MIYRRTYYLEGELAKEEEFEGEAGEIIALLDGMADMEDEMYSISDEVSVGVDVDDIAERLAQEHSKLTCVDGCEWEKRADDGYAELNKNFEPTD